MSDISESIIMRWLDRFGPLPETLLYTMVGEKNQYALNKILKSNQYTRSLSFQNDIVSTRNSYYLDTKTVDALWVLSEMIENVDPVNINSAPAPSQVFFIRTSKKTNETKCYEIAVFYKGEENKLRTLVVDSYTNYIFVIPSCEAIDTFMTQINRLNIPCSQFRFAVVEHQDKKKRPVVNIYKIEEGAA